MLTTEADLARVAAARPLPPVPGLLTIGYEGRSLGNYLNQLVRAAVTILCDFRRNPLSRKYGFARSTLRTACEGVGLRYEHLPELGIDATERGGLHTQTDYDALFAAYERECLPRQTAALARIRGWIENDRERVALTCYEANPCQCHRHCVAEALAQLGGRALAPQHLQPESTPSGLPHPARQDCPGHDDAAIGSAGSSTETATTAMEATN